MAKVPKYDFPRCLRCRRHLKNAKAQHRGYGSTCWAHWQASLEQLDPADPRVFQAAITEPLFPEIFK